MELTLRGWRDLDRRKSMDDVFRARGRFESALHHDPESVITLNGLAATYQSERADPARQLTKAQIATHRDLVDRARRLAPDDSTALLLWGNLQIMESRPDLALPALEKASRLVPSDPMGHVLVAQSLLLLGRLDKVQERADRAIARSTGDPRRESSAYAIAAEAALMLGQEERARGLARHAVAAFPDNLYAHATLASIEALAGRQDLAAIELAALLRLWPEGHHRPLRRPSPFQQSCVRGTSRAAVRGSASRGSAGRLLTRRPAPAGPQAACCTPQANADVLPETCTSSAASVLMSRSSHVSPGLFPRVWS